MQALKNCPNYSATALLGYGTESPQLFQLGRQIYDENHKVTDVEDNMKILDINSGQWKEVHSTDNQP